MLVATSRKTANILSVEKLIDGLLIKTGHGILKLKVINSSIVRIMYSLDEELSDRIGIGLVEISNESPWSYEESDDFVTLKTDLLRVTVSKSTAAITYYDKDGILLTREPASGGKELIPYDSFRQIIDEDTKVERIETPDGVKEIIVDERKEYNGRLYRYRLNFDWQEGEALYGLGQQEEGTLNLRGTRQYLHQANMKIAVPMMVSTRGYGILSDVYSPMIFNDNAYGSYLYAEAVKAMDFYFIYGKDLDQVINGYRTLTGKAALLPKWSFGYIQSLERYESQEEILDIVKSYRREGVPLDGVVLDWQYWDKGMWGQKSFDQTRFPDPRAMMDQLHGLGAHLLISLWPNMSKASENYSDMKEAGHLLPMSEIYNAFDQESRDHYWKQVKEGIYKYGIDGWWCDSSEPYTPEWNETIRPEPDRNYRDFQDLAAKYLDETQTNAFGLVHAKGIYDGQRAESDKKRIINLTRSGYIGQQKYGVILWSGDISATWKTLKNQIPAGLNLCAAGLPFWTFDIGAFFTKKGQPWFWNGDYEEGNEDLGYRELYTRWYQVGAFLPVFRSHGTDTRREIWEFGEAGSLFYDAIKKATDLRYRLMPYIYTLAGLTWMENMTMLRLLAFDHKEDPLVNEIKDQFMFGQNMMICPVTDPMYYEANSIPIACENYGRQVYLPEGKGWFDFYTHERHEGGQWIWAQAPIDKIPVYVPEGSLIPMTSPGQSTKDMDDKDMELTVYTGKDGHGKLYLDQGDGYDYEKGHYHLVSFDWIDKTRTLIFRPGRGSYEGMPEIIDFKITIIGPGHESLEITHKYDGKEKIIAC